MRVQLTSSALLTVAALAALTLQARADDPDKFFAAFSGFQELGALNKETGAIFSPGKASHILKVDKANQVIHYTLSYSGLTSDVQQSHIHFGKRHVPGNVMVFFCTNLNNGPTGVTTPVCPNPSGTVTGTIAASNVVAIPTQNVMAGDLSAVFAALQSDTAYGNIHTANFPAGEIRGQIVQGDDDR
jgi:hypothetical protein